MRAGRCFLEKHSWKGAEFSLSPRMAPSVPHTAPRKALYRCGVGDGADQTGGPAGPGPPNAICSLADTRGFPAGRQRTAHRTARPRARLIGSEHPQTQDAPSVERALLWQAWLREEAGSRPVRCV